MFEIADKHEKVPTAWVLSSSSGVAKEDNVVWRENSQRNFPFKGMASSNFLDNQKELQTKSRTDGQADIEFEIAF